ncbi:class I SAM-dependent methyltransferase [Aquimarina intermedia]|uniref:Nodulation protein S (NodS) n=1 Tax=Aquimarina intermedia TaxID=350814 RepID=A0A5S5C8C5_9FLAO|nr:class I SAM-dependent methyltransferase [Aquimarina intermedia]TYP74243.1 nodulation protein S (NodS) [Aquimarina intermedia]
MESTLDFDREKHWENIYNSKSFNEVSWYQKVPDTSLKFIIDAKLPKSAKIIDVGGGDSLLVDHLLRLGYQNITVLDISHKAIDRAKERLGILASKITWIVEDITNFKTSQQYDLWHDRAVFHFLTSEHDVQAYKSTLNHTLTEDGKAIIGTFSESGPTKCSGIEIKQYSDTSLKNTFSPDLLATSCAFFDHNTPFNTKQNFVFCNFKKSTNNL